MKIRILLASSILLIGICSFGQGNTFPIHTKIGQINEEVILQDAINGIPIQNKLTTVQILPGNLIAYYPFNGDALDATGNGHDGTVYGGMLTEDRNENQNSAYTFPNVHDQIVLGNSSDLHLQGGFTLNAWIKYKNINCDIVAKHNCWTPNGFILGIEDGQFGLWLSDGGWHNIKTNETYHENKWYMVTAVYDSVNKTGLIYVDGKLKGSGNAIYSNYNSASITISEPLGGCPGGNMPGVIDDVKILGLPLSEQEIQAEYNLTHTGLVAFYPFNGNANDESGNNLHLTINGAVTAADRFGNGNNAFFFNGNASISCTDNDLLDLTNDFSISFWIKNPGTVLHQFVLSKHYAGEDDNGSWGIASYADGNTYTFTATPNWGFGPPNPTTPVITENEWHHITFTYKKNTAEWKAFMDGLPSGSGTLEFNIQNTDRDFMIGTCMQYNTNLTAYLDDIRIYNCVINDQQVLELYNDSTTNVKPQSNLIAFYPFNGNANDESGNGNNGTTIGSLTSTADRYGTQGKAYKFWHPDHISVPTNSSFFSNEFTVSYWYKVASYWGERGVLSCVGKNGGYQQYFTGTNFAYLIGYDFPNGNSFFSSNYTVSDTPDTWHHVTATYQKTGENSSVSKFYINGELKKTDNQSVAIAYPGEEKFNIGKNVDVNFNGELDDIRVYSKSLTDQDIKDLYLTETKPVLQNPANQSSVHTLTPEMLWISPLANGEFRFQLSSDSLFGSILHELVTNYFSTQIPELLLTEGQIYYWRVSPLLNGETGPWSPVWSFDFVNTGIDSPKANSFSLRIYPNPANASAKISYSLPENGTNGVLATIEIVNSIGKCVKKMTAENAKYGNSEVEVETSSLPSGIYYCRLNSGNTSIARKLVILH